MCGALGVSELDPWEKLRFCGAGSIGWLACRAGAASLLLLLLVLQSVETRELKSRPLQVDAVEVDSLENASLFAQRQSWEDLSVQEEKDEPLAPVIMALCGSVSWWV